MNDEMKQQRAWQLLHDAVTATMNRFGTKDARGRADYWLLDENWGWRTQQLEFQNLDLLQASLFDALRRLLVDFPDWDITVRIDVPDKRGVWPGMGLIIYEDEIVDELRRDVLPEKFRNLIFGTISQETEASIDERVRKLMKPPRGG